jgi:hypothetical protein
MKRIQSILLVIALTILLAACSTLPLEQTKAPQETPPAPQQNPPTPESQKMVVFADPTLEAMVCEAMGKPICGITLAEAEALTTLDLSFEWRQHFSGTEPIRDIGGLEHFINLKYLDLSDHAITDLTPLAGLNKLTLLALGGNPIADIAPLANLASLEFLMLNNSAITDATPLAGLTNLKRLYLAGCELDYFPLADIYPNLEDKDFVIPSTLTELGFYMHYEQYEQKEARFDTDQVSVRINHSEWGDFFMEGMWKNNVRTVFGTDTYKVDIGYSPENDAYMVLANKDGEWAVNYVYTVADGSLSFELGDRASSERVIREIFPDAAGDGDLLLLPIRFHTDALQSTLGITANKLIELPFETLSLNSLGFVESEEVHGYLYAHNEQGDCFDVAIHDPKQEAWEFGGDVSFFTPLSEEYRVVVFYHIDEKQFTVRLDDNKLGGAEYHYLVDSQELVDIWCSEKDLSVEQYLRKAINDPAITDTYDVYHYAIKQMVLTVEDTFGMGIEELYALSEQ